MSKMLGLVVAGAVALGAIGVGTAYASLGQFTGIVLRVIDGDTLVATVKGQEATIRLLNVDTPETKDPNRAPECLGPEASDFLSDRLPIGTRIGLKYDKDRTDQYGRTLAAVYQSESLINAEIARAGLGAAVLFEPNRKYYNEVRAAQQAAQETRVGLYDSQVGCTLPAEVDRVVQSLEQTSSQVPVDSSAATSAMDAAAVALTLGEGLEATLDAIDAGSDALRSAAYAGQISAYRQRLTPALTRTNELKEQHRVQLGLLQAEEHRLAEAARLAETARLAEQTRQADAARVAEETRLAEAARLAAKARLAETARLAAKARKATAPAQTAKKQTTTKITRTKVPRTAKTTAPSNPYPGYTGPRCYAPGGKTWRPC